jgi:circadian clock protein KaiC
MRNPAGIASDLPRRRGSMKAEAKLRARDLPNVGKAPTGIAGLDEVTYGGLPQGRSTLLCGSAGCGKTLVALTFLYNGVTQYGEPGVFIAFEEQSEDLVKNVGSLGYDLDKLIAEKRFAIDHVHLDPNQIAESGEYDLEGLFIRLGYAIDSIGAKRVVIDTVETLLGGLQNQALLRSELRRLFEWLKEKGVTAIITAESGEHTLTRYGLEEYVADCVIFLDHRVRDQLSTRRLRIVKYRGSAHGTNEYPFIIDQQGITVMPVTSVGLEHEASTERVSSGIPDLDVMLEGKGYFKGSSILVSGMAGSGKTSVAAHFADSTCASGRRFYYFAMEESPQQITRNMRSLGIDLQKWVDKKLLRFSARRPNLYGLETHLAAMHRDVIEFDPTAIAVDPMSSLVSAGLTSDAHSMLLRLVDFLKSRGVTALFTNLGAGGAETATTEMLVSSLMDTWLLLYNRESNGEHNRQLYLLKSRGMAHSNQIREFILSNEGIRLREAYVGPEGVLTGSARIAQEGKEKAAQLVRKQEIERRSREVERKRREISGQIEILQAHLASITEEGALLNREDVVREEQLAADRAAQTRSRKVSQSQPLPAVRQKKGQNQ